MKTKLKQKLTLSDFHSIVAWEEIKIIMGKRRYKKFCKWMEGQTCTTHGVYAYDLDRFLKGLPNLD